MKKLGMYLLVGALCLAAAGLVGGCAQEDTGAKARQVCAGTAPSALTARAYPLADAGAKGPFFSGI